MLWLVYVACGICCWFEVVGLWVVGLWDYGGYGVHGVMGVMRLWDGVMRLCGYEVMGCGVMRLWGYGVMRMVLVL